MATQSGAPAGTALVTGASSGIGAAFAERLAKDGHDLILVARRADRLRALARRLQDDHPRTADVLTADLSNPDDLQRVEARVKEGAALTTLVNCAGFALRRPFLEGSPEEIEEQLQVHIIALTRLTHAALPGMLERRAGAIVNVSSVAGFMAAPGPGWTTYAASKAYVTTFTLGLAQLVRDSGVLVQALCPGWTRTEILERAGRSWDIPDQATMDADAVVAASLAALQRGDLICAPSVDDEALLLRLAQAQQAIVQQGASSGALAARYAHPADTKGSAQ